MQLNWHSVIYYISDSKAEEIPVATTTGIFFSFTEKGEHDMNTNVTRVTPAIAQEFGYKSVSDMKHKIKWYHDLFGINQKLCFRPSDEAVKTAFYDPKHGHVLVAS